VPLRTRKPTECSREAARQVLSRDAIADWEGHRSFLVEVDDFPKGRSRSDAASAAQISSPRISSSCKVRCGIKKEFQDDRKQIAVVPEECELGTLRPEDEGVNRPPKG